MEEIFKVQVLDVNTINKTEQTAQEIRAGLKVNVPTRKRLWITLAPGNRNDEFFEGV